MKNEMNQGQQKIVNEKDLQRLIRHTLRNPLAEWRTTSGALLTVLSVGEWNHHEGPDFLNMALQVEGTLVLGHGEVHWRSSDWERHHHEAHPMYEGLALHIVLHDNRASTPFARYTLVLPEEIVLKSVQSEISEIEMAQISQPNDIESVLRDYAAQRFMRKSQQARAMLMTRDTDAVFMRLLSDFVQRRLSKKHLPKGLKNLADVLSADSLQNPEHRFIEPFLRIIHISLVPEAHAEEGAVVESAVMGLLETAQCGQGTATEILVNIVLPLAYAHCEASQRIDAAQVLFRSFWRIPAANQYAHLKRKFSHIPQRYVWQQQGLLEYEAEVGAPQKHSPSTLQAIAAHQTPEMVITFYAA